MPSARSNALFRIGWCFAVAMAVAVHIGTWSGPLIWDDTDLVWDPALPGGGSAVGGGDTFWHCFTRPFLWNYYRPLVSASFYIEHHLFGRNPLGYHVSNSLIHALATALLVPLLVAAFRRRRVAVAGAVLFAVHPVHVSAVAWIGGRTDALCSLWAALFAWTLIRSARTTGRARAGWVAASTLAYLLALFTKEQMLAALPLVPLAYACFKPAEGSNRRGAGWVATVPFAVAAMLFLYAGTHLGMPKVPPPRVDRITQMAMAGWTWIHYARVMTVPTPGLLYTFSMSGYERAGWAGGWLGWILAAGVVAAFGLLMRAHRPAAWFVALVVLLLGPVSNLTPMWFLLLAPYRAALSVIGACALLGWLVGFDCRRQREAAWAGAAALVLLGTWYVGVTVASLPPWRDEQRLFQTIVDCDPDSVLGNYMRARYFLGVGDETKAVPYVERMLRWLYRSDAWTRPDDAVRAALNDRALRQRVLQHQGSAADPRIFLNTVFTQRGFGESRLGDYATARLSFETAERLNPGTADTNVGLGYLCYLERNFVEAEKHYLVAINAWPTRPDARLLLAQTYQAWGRNDDARRVLGIR